MRTITIDIDPDKFGFKVSEGGKSCDQLCWDEMLGTVVELTHPGICGKTRYRMLTDEEHAAERARHDARMAEIHAAEAAGLPVPPIDAKAELGHICTGKPPF